MTPSTPQELPPEEMILKLREMALTLDPSEIGLSKENFENDVFGIIMETGIDDGFYTLIVLGDGTTSLYFSNGGGIIGGGEHQNVKNVSEKYLSTAQRFYEKGKIVTEYPIPENGYVTFFFLTFKGVLSYRVLENDIGNEKDLLSPLFFDAHYVIGELRQLNP